MTAHAYVFKVTKSVTEDTVNGPNTRVTVVPAGPLETSKGEWTFPLYTEEDRRAFEVGKLCRVEIEALE